MADNMNLDTATEFVRWARNSHYPEERSPVTGTPQPGLKKILTHDGPRYMDPAFFLRQVSEWEKMLETPPSRPLAGAFSLAAGLIGFVVAMAAAI